MLVIKCRICGESFVPEWFGIHLDRDHGIDPNGPPPEGWEPK
jgi:hypothetical protein